MAKLKLGAIADDKPVKLTVELPAAVHRDLVAYAEALGRETGQPVNEPAKLIAPMLARFIAGDRAFAKLRSVRKPTSGARRRRPDANERARLKKRRSAGLSLPGNHTALYGSMSSAVASGRKTTSGYRVAVDASLAMLMPKPSPTRCIKVSRPTPWRSIEGLRPKAVVRRTM